MHYAVPQFIDVEDKIVGPLTMKQFLWLLLGGAISFILYFLLKFGVWLLITILLGALFSALAFIRVYHMPLIAFLTSLARFSLMPQIFLWEKKAEGPLRDVPIRKAFEDAFEAPSPHKPRPTQGKLRALDWQLNMQGTQGDREA